MISHSHCVQTVASMHSIFILPFLLAAGLAGLVQTGWAALSPLPDSLKVESYVTYLEGEKLSRFRTTEYVDLEDGSIRLELENVGGRSSKAAAAAATNDDESSKSMTFFRLMGKNDRDNDQQMDSRLVAYNPETNTCGELHIQVWPLRDFSKLLTELTSSRHKLLPLGWPSGAIKTLLGPAGLLRLVHGNANLFVLNGRSRDELSLRDELHFELRLVAWEKNQKQVAKVIVSVLVDEPLPINNSSKSSSDKTRLSELEPSAQVSSIAIALLPKDNNGSKTSGFERLDKLEAPALLEELRQSERSLVTGAVASYALVQERSLGRHSGLSSLADELDEPFLMPAGVGCGAASNNQPLFVRPSQFSGQFEASDFGNQFYVAYDEPSNHLRYDLEGELKMVYALSDQSVTYVAADAALSLTRLNARLAARLHEASGQPGPAAANSTTGGGQVESAYYDKSHCAQASLIDERGPAPGNRGVLYNQKSLKDLLGLGEGAGLAYLGQARLTNTDHAGQNGPYEPIPCRVFERPIAHSQVPALLHMHLRLRPRENNRLTLIFYFVDELNALTRASPFSGQLNAFESLWLKRVELVSRNSISKYVFSNAQLTFSKSSWSLETLGEDTRNRETQLAHPVRAFDLAECWPTRALVQLELVLKQQNQLEWARKGLEQAESSLSVKQFGQFEESLMGFLWRQIGFARSRVSGFAMQTASGGSSANLETLLLQAQLSFPFPYTYQTKLVAWLESFEPLLAKRQALFVSLKQLALVHECSLQLAALLRNPYHFHMLFCPNLGCGLLLVEPLELDGAAAAAAAANVTTRSRASNYHQATGEERESPSVSKLDVYRDLCELHRVSKAVSQLGMISKDHRVEMVAGSLKQAAVKIEAFELDAASQELRAAPYRAQVAKAAVVNAGSLQATGHDELLVASLCFTPQTRLLKDGLPHAMAQGALVIRQLLLDHHHSRAHCRRACAMFAHCETYSYNHLARACLLTNVLPHLLRDPSITLEQVATREADCAIYALDALVRYRRTPSSILRKPSDLLEFHGAHSQKSVLLRASLGQCARLAHASDWSLRAQPGDATVEASSQTSAFFNYMQLKQLCVLDALPSRREFLLKFAAAGGLEPGVQLIESAEQLAQLVGAGGLEQVEAYETYKQHLQQFYARKFGFRVELRGGQSGSGEGASETGSANRNEPALLASAVPSVLEASSLDFEQCLRACSSLERHCAMFDYCAGVKAARYAKTCRLFNVRSPFALEQLAELHARSRFRSSAWPRLKIEAPLPRQRLSAAEQLVYLEQRNTTSAAAAASVLVATDDDCQHYYLAGDNLYVKRLLAGKQAAASPTTTKGDAESEDEDGNSDEDDQESRGQFGNIKEETMGELSRAALLMAQALVGLAGGVGLFIVRPTLGAWRRRPAELAREPSRARRRLDELGRALGANRWARRRAPDQVRLELNELHEGQQAP